MGRCAMALRSIHCCMARHVMAIAGTVDECRAWVPRTPARSQIEAAEQGVFVGVGVAYL